MSSTVTYKGNTLTTVDNQTRVLSTKGKYLEDDITIVDVSGGGGSSSAERKQVYFIDYDGTILYSYTAEEAQALTELPANPSHSGLVAQGWNWSLANIKSQLTNIGGDVWVGQMYETESGKTEIDINVDNPVCLSPYLAICPNGTCTIDWGDGTATDTVTGTSYTSLKFTPHVYATTGRYTISIDGPIGFYCGSTNCGALLTDKASLSNRRTYSQYVEAIRCADGVYIGVYAFYNCYALQSITIPKGVTSIGAQAFQNCYALQSVTIPNGVKYISGSAFQSCYALQSITIPESVTSIGSNAFYGCYALQSITIPKGVTSIGSGALCDCHILQSITIPDGVTDIGQAFQYCSALQSITIPDSVTSIGNNTFQGCSALQSITIPDSVTSIEARAFYNCYALQSITIPDGVTSIGSYAFYNCYSLQSVTIPDGVTNIWNYAFQNCYSIQSVTIPNGVTNIRVSAFQGCSALQSITIPDSVISIGASAFYNCYALQSITIPDSVISIGASAFYNCYALQSITIPDGVTSIGSGAFYNCYSVMEYHLLPTTPPTLASTNVFANIIAETIIYVPKGSLEAYTSATNWSRYASYMQEEP